MRVLITGGAGFIGSYLTERYLELGHDVVVLDNMSGSTLLNIKHLQENIDYLEKLDIRVGDINNAPFIESLIEECDIVLHLAAATGLRKILREPFTCINTNVSGTLNVLELCSKFKKKVLVISTAEVYGKQDTEKPLREDDDIVWGETTKTRWAYPASKLLSEYSTLAYTQTAKLDAVIIRLFNTIGPRQTSDYGMVVQRFINQALKTEALTVYGNGNQTRTFLYINDAVDVIIKLAEEPTSGKVVNVGSEEIISIIDLARKIIDLSKSSSKVVYVSEEKIFNSNIENVQHKTPSLENLRQLIGDWEPIYDLNLILSTLISHYKG